MAVKMRLQRRGRKARPFYHIVIADVRAPRDGRIVERIGSYNPNTTPSSVSLDFDRALYWLNVGAQPTDTVKNILSKEGVLMMKHLLGGVKKGAFDEAEAQKRFEAWKSNKENELNKSKEQISAEKKAKEEARLQAEKDLLSERKKALADKKAEELAAKEAEIKAAAAAEEEAASEEEAPAAEEPASAE